MNDAVDSFLGEYDDATNDVAGSGSKMYLDNLQAWFDAIESNAAAKQILRTLVSRVEFDTWYEAAKKTTGSIVGSGTLKWPHDRDDALGMQLSLFRSFATKKEDWTDFSTHFMYEDGYDMMVRAITTQIFNKTARELRKRIERSDTQESIPASDRIVRRDDNRQAIDEAQETIGQIKTALVEMNDDSQFANHQEKQRLIAEIAAGSELMNAPEIRPKAIGETVWAALRALAKKTFDTGLSKLIGLGLERLARLFFDLLS